MSGAILPLPQYAFVAWCSVKKSTGTNLPSPYLINIKMQLILFVIYKLFIEFIENLCVFIRCIRYLQEFELSIK
jgi:hypothetical protein